jgi:hypothetical protein
MKIRRFLLLSFFALLSASCANRIAPEGGPKDVTPPKLISSQPENFSHSFSGNEISLQFDENIQLRETDKQILISPLPEEKPEITVNKKLLKLKFKKALQSHTTYTISFGNAISDIHESNALTGFRFVFSTGTFVDSLSIHGTVTDAFTLKPAGEVTVMLYEQPGDSLPYTSLPSYAAQTDASGNFTFENLRASNFKLFALKDKNHNYLYDHPDELIAWTDEPVRAGDTIMHALQLIKEVPLKLKLLAAASPEPVKVILAFNKNAEVELKPKNGTPSWHSYTFNKTGDSLTIWMADTLQDSLNVYLYENNQLFDSVFMALKKPVSVKQRTTGLQPLVVTVPAFHAGEKISFTVSHPLRQTHHRLIKIKSDSVEAELPSLIASEGQAFMAAYELMPEKKYELLLLPGALTDIYNRSNDTLKIPLKILSEKETGSLYVQIKNENDYSLLVSLVDEKEQSIRDTVLTGRQTAVSFQYLSAGVYKLKAVEDSNRNGRWDSGNYLSKQKPERVTYFKEPITIRANWDVEHIWNPVFK